MATIVLSTVGGAIGSVFGPLGLLAGRALGAMAGAAIDGTLAASLSPARHVQGPRLKELHVQASTEGAPIPRIHGRVRLAGQIIWATRLEEEVRTQSGGGKGGGPKVKSTTYHYHANFAVALCEGPVARIERIWADGKPLDVAADGIVMRFYPGTETQDVDPLIAAREGAANAPAYRGTAYVVFERLALEPFGNRIPQFTFEVVRPVDDVADKLRAVNIIPGAGEFFCDPRVMTKTDGPAMASAENAHASEKRSDWSVSIDQLQATAPNLQKAALVVSWFGDDLRCGHCAIRPKVEVVQKMTDPEQWRVAGLTRASAQTVSQRDGRPAFGGTPSDASVIHAIRDLTARGLKPVLYPFVMMDIPPGNGLPDPYGGAEQPPFPWRGRITCDPAPGHPDSPDRSAVVNTQLDAFIGKAQPSDFSLNGDEVVYSGPDEWSYRRFILHYAWLAKAAGGLEAFLIGSELRGLTWLRNGPDGYPFVQALRQLAADVKSILGSSVKVSYAADWSEWFGHHPNDGSNDVYFHLDPLWADASIDFIGIDNYMPLADWRGGMDHLDARAGAKSIYDQDYLKANIAGGEGYDWYYASAADRDAQVRTPITDGAHNKPWVFRYKDILNWWQNQHFDRPGGAESATPTAWQPQGKPIWFTEAGCPALDKGANQPNVFYDPKSSESALPYFSSGRRDDAMQKAYMRAMLDYWNAPGAHNPVSSVYGAPMVDAESIFFWAWDARPYPWYPARTDVWADAAPYEVGHWLNGRLDAPSLPALVRAILADWRFPTDRLGIEGIPGQVTGYVLDRPMSARAALEPLAAVFGFDAVESGGKLVFRPRQQRVTATLEAERFVEDSADTPLFEIARADTTETPEALALSYLEETAEHRTAVIRVRATAQGALVADSGREPMLSLQLPAALPQSVAGGLASMALRQARVGRERASFILGPEHLALEPGDVVSLALPANSSAATTGRLWRITSVAQEGLTRRIEAIAHDPLALEPPPWPSRRYRAAGRQPLPAPEVLVLDIPRLADDHDARRPYVVAFSSPWPGGVSVLKRPTDAHTSLIAPAIIGELLDDLPPGRPWLWQRVPGVRVKIHGGHLASVNEHKLFAGHNAAVIGRWQKADGVCTGTFEVVQFRNAELIAPGVWRLSMFLRGQRGSEPEITTHPAGSRFVLLDAALAQLAGSGDADIGQLLDLRAGPASRDVTDATWRDLAVSFAGRGLRPLSPVHLRRRVEDNGDWTFTWIRRARLPEAADAWGMGDAPLVEERERYELALFDGATEIRRWRVDAPRATWTAAQRAADFPAGLPAQVTLRVAQISPLHGPGAWAEGSFDA